MNGEPGLPLPVASVDVGSNSVHLLVARSDPDAHSLVRVADESAFLGLGTRVAEHGFLGAVCRSDTVNALRAFSERAGELGAGEVTAVGTQPIRRARDAARLVRAVEREVGMALHVLTHREEALLTLIGATGGRRPRRAAAVVDIGGGSTEIAVASASGHPVAAAIPIGSAVLRAAVEEHDPPSARDVEAMARLAREALDGVDGGVVGLVEELVVVGGTAENLLRIAPDGELSATVTRGRLDRAVAALVAEPADAVAARFRVRPVRARLLPAGAAIVRALLDRFDLDAATVSSAGIREGAILARARGGACWRDALPELACGWEGDERRK